MTKKQKKFNVLLNCRNNRFDTDIVWILPKKYLYILKI